MPFSVPPGYFQVNGTDCFVPLSWPAFLHEQNKFWTIGVILSAVIYGGLLSLTLSYVPFLLKTSHVNSRRMRIFLLVYVVFMVTISTVYIATIIIALKNNLLVASSSYNNYLCIALFGISAGWFQNGYTGGICITLASWGADGFMLWRCAMIYDGISRPRRIALLSVLGLMGLMSLGSGLALPTQDGFYFFLAINGVTVFSQSRHRHPDNVANSIF